MKWQDLQPPVSPARVPDYLLRLRRARLYSLRSGAARLEALAGSWAGLGCLDEAQARYAEYRQLMQEADELAARLAQEDAS